MKKLVCTILCVILALTTFAVPLALAEEKITLTFLETMPAEAKTERAKAMIDAFMAAHPNVTVEFMSVPNDQASQKLITLAAANQLPDIIELNDSWLAPLAGNGKLANLDDYLQDWDQKDNIVQAAYDLGRVMDNKLYYLPYGLWGIIVFYNEEMLAATGMKPPTTTDEFYEVAKAMNNPEAGKFGYAFRGGMYGPCHAIMWMLSEVGAPDIFKDGKCVFDTPEAIRGLEKYKQLYTVAPPDSTNWAYRECVAGFTSGVCGLLLQGNEVVNICNEKMGEGTFNTAMLPLGSSGMTFDTSGQAGYAMSADTQHPEMAIELFKFLLDPDVSRDFVVHNSFTPVNKLLADEPVFSEGPSKVFMDQLLNPNIPFSINPSYLPEWGEIVGAYGTAEIQKMFLGEQSAEDTAKNLAAFLNQGLENYLASN